MYNTVNNQNYLIDPETGAKTQTMRYFWRHIKLHGLKSNGATKLLKRQFKEE